MLRGVTLLINLAALRASLRAQGSPRQLKFMPQPPAAAGFLLWLYLHPEQLPANLQMYAEQASAARLSLGGRDWHVVFERQDAERLENCKRA